MHRLRLPIALLGTVLLAGPVIAVPVAATLPAEDSPAPPDAAPFEMVFSKTDGVWAVPALMMVVCFFACAAMVGPLVRAEMAEEIAPAQSHDEPPGTSGHHGPVGAIDLHPPEAEAGEGEA